MELKFDQGRGYNFEAKALEPMSNVFISEIISLSETILIQSTNNCDDVKSINFTEGNFLNIVLILLYFCTIYTLHNLKNIHNY